MEHYQLMSFDQFTEDRSNEYDANRQMSAKNFNTSTSHQLPGAAINKKEEDRKREIHNAAQKHVSKGQSQHAFDAAYKIAHGHATEDRHDPQAAHEIATRKAKYAVKKAQESLKK